MSRITAPRGSFGYAQDRLFDSAPSAVPRDKSVRRFAQDDDFVGGLKKNTPNRITLVGLHPGLRSDVPSGLEQSSHTSSRARIFVGPLPPGKSRALIQSLRAVTCRKLAFRRFEIW